MKRGKPGYAPAKAKLLTEAMRAAAHDGASAQAQALLAILIAEAWPEGNAWVARMGWPVLERRLNTSRRTIRRWAHELDELNLVQRIPGDGRQLSQWGIFRDARRGCTSATPGDAQTHSGGCTSATPGDAHTHPVSRLTQDITQERADDVDGPTKAHAVGSKTRRRPRVTTPAGT